MNLSPRQEHILRFVKEFSERSGYPPTIREIGKAVSISSTSVVNYNLEKLVEGHYLERDRTVSRGLKLAGQKLAAAMSNGATFRVPLVGSIVASAPMPVPDDSFAHIPHETVELTRSLVREQEGLYALKVKGNSMVDALINDGDIVVMKKQTDIHNGDMVAVWLRDKGETTLKRFYREKNRVRLQPANPTMQPIYAHPSNVEVQGKVVVVIRQLA